VFIRVKIDSLKEFSNEKSEIVKNEVRIKRVIININTEKKYLNISFLSKLVSKNKFLFTKIFLGLI
tara:strand:+ start:431 stop:628 length:198 start_codon:yes stop_codon:yes gene_type:complete